MFPQINQATDTATALLLAAPTIENMIELSSFQSYFENFLKFNTMDCEYVHATDPWILYHRHMCKLFKGLCLYSDQKYR